MMLYMYSNQLFTLILMLKQAAEFILCGLFMSEVQCRISPEYSIVLRNGSSVLLLGR